MKKSETILIALSSFLLGLVIGFLVSPVKKGFDIGNNSGNTTTYHYGNTTDMDME